MHTMTIGATIRVATWRTLAYSLALAFDRWRCERRTAAALYALSDATLKDIGIYRCEIPWRARSLWAGPGSPSHS